MTPPSKKLLTNILGFEVRIISIVDNTLLCTKKTNRGFTDIRINVYELMHLMKEWAYSLDEFIISSYWVNGGEVDIYGRYSCADSQPDKSFSADTEFEAVTKACEYILKETK